jgi:hypothetical protein
MDAIKAQKVKKLISTFEDIYGRFFIILIESHFVPPS